MIPSAQQRKTIKHRTKPANLSAVALFSGGGGLDLGFAAAGFNIRVSTDIDRISCETLFNNMHRGKRFYPPHPIIAEDIRKLTAKSILAAGDLRKEEVDVVIGGPPCQTFSVSGHRRGLNDPRGDLIFEFLRVVRGIRPKAFVFENVQGLATLNDGDVLRRLERRLSMSGAYQVKSHFYEMAWYGIPQWRRRVFIAGSRVGDAPPFMPETHGPDGGLKPLRTVEEALSAMPAPGHDLANHRSRSHGDRVSKRYHRLKHGMRDPYTRINRLNPQMPSYTIVVGSDSGGGKGHVHPHEPREVTPRESARLQTFPDWWEFTGNVRHMIRQVGNAVPPLFAAQYAKHIRRHVFGHRRLPSDNRLAQKIGLDFLTDD